MIARWMQFVPFQESKIIDRLDWQLALDFFEQKLIENYSHEVKTLLHTNFFIPGCPLCQAAAVV